MREPDTPAAAQVETSASPLAPRTRRRQIGSIELFGGGRELLIEHAGEIYLLRQTSKGKLILTK